MESIGELTTPCTVHSIELSSLPARWAEEVLGEEDTLP